MYCLKTSIDIQMVAVPRKLANLVSIFLENRHTQNKN